MRHGVAARIALGLLGACWSAGWSRADDVSGAPQAAVRQAEFEDTAVATVNPNFDAAQPAAPSPATMASPAALAAPPASADTAPLSAQPADPSSASDNDRESRLAALKARLREHMGGEAEPPAEEPPPPPPAPAWRLPQPQTLQQMDISLSGWLQQGITFNGNHPADGFNGPVDMNDLSSEYQLNQFWMTLQRPVNTGGNGFDMGGRIDASYGTDWRWNINNGLENRIDGFNGQTYGLMLPQFYAEAGYNDLDVKLGHFEAPLEYEGLAGPANFFYSHSYGYTYGVPHQVTGMLADCKLDENWSIQGGIHRGWSQFEDDNHSMDVMGGFHWQSSDRKTMISYAASNGPQDINSAENRFVYSLVIQEQLGPRSQYVLVHDLGVENNALPGGGTADWYGLNQYYVYNLNSQWAACVRGEWFRDQDGVAVIGPGNMPGVRAWAGHGFAGNFYELTAGVNWRPQSNVLFRPEVRYDWYDGGEGGYSNANQPGLPFNNGRSSSQLLTAADLIVLF